MNSRRKRHIASWVLLAVFLPMLIVSSLHIHHVQVVNDTCNECVHHHCGGHLEQQTTPFHACVLCQFLTLPMLAVAVVATLLLHQFHKTGYVTRQRNVCVAHYSIVGLRAPPFHSI